jgi:peptidoglycan/xylan/chitin deacetylase (PgdA/CDA1 family)
MHRGWRKSANFLDKAVPPTAALLSLLLSCWLIPAQSTAFWAKKKEVVSRAPGEGRSFQSDRVVVYVVKKGDRLSDLATRFYGDPEKGWLIEEANDHVPLEPGQVLVIPLRSTNPGGLSVRGYQVVPVLLYHHFSTECRTALCMPIDEFSRQMDYLQKKGYRTVSLTQVLKFINYQEPLPPKAVVITIDDGYRSVYDLVYPELKRYNFKATLFIYTTFVGNSPNALTWDQLREMNASGFEVEAHTISHADLTRKGEEESETAYLQRIKTELELPRELIQQKLGREVNFLAYPYGRFNDQVIAMANEAGYLGAVTVVHGENPFFTNPFKIKRHQVMNSPKAVPFEQLLKILREEELQ